MQSLDIISVNLWQILISLANLLILFLIIKKVLYGPVKRVLAERQAEIDGRYEEADNAKREALAANAEWQAKLGAAKEEADGIIQTATKNADKRGEKIVAEAKEKAEIIIRQAETEAELEKKKAKEEIKYEIVTISAALAEKMLSREISEDDHKELINSFIDGIGDANDGNV